MRLLLLLLAVSAFGQSTTPTNPSKLSAFDENFITGMIEYTSKATPHFTGAIAGGHLVSSQGSYAVFESFWTVNKQNRLVNATTLNGAQYMRTFQLAGKPVSLYALLGAGASTGQSATGSAVAAAYNGGMFGVRDLYGSLKATFLVQDTNTTGRNILTIGLGLGWGK